VAELARAEEALVARRPSALVATIFADRRDIPIQVHRLVFELIANDLGEHQGENGEWVAELNASHCSEETQRQLVGDVGLFLGGYERLDLLRDHLRDGREPVQKRIAWCMGKQIGRFAWRPGAFRGILKNVAETTTVKGDFKGEWILPQDLLPETDERMVLIQMKWTLVSIEISGPTLAIVQGAKLAVQAVMEDFERKALRIGTH